MLVLTFLAALAASGGEQLPLPKKGSPEQRADYERGQANQKRFEQSLFVRAGFQPIEALAAEKRSVRRVLFSDPYMMLPVPGIEVEQRADGSVSLTVVYHDASRQSAELPPPEWNRLAQLQGGMLDPAPYVAWDPPSPDVKVPPPPPICHGWIVRFGTAGSEGTRSGSWAECGGEGGSKMAFAIEMARLAVSTRPNCTFEAGNPFWSFRKCFAPESPSPTVRHGDR